MNIILKDAEKNLWLLPNLPSWGKHVKCTAVNSYEDEDEVLLLSSGKIASRKTFKYGLRVYGFCEEEVYIIRYESEAARFIDVLKDFGASEKDSEEFLRILKSLTPPQECVDNANSEWWQAIPFEGGIDVSEALTLLCGSLER